MLSCKCSGRNFSSFQDSLPAASRTLADVQLAVLNAARSTVGRTEYERFFILYFVSKIDEKIEGETYGRDSSHFHRLENLVTMCTEHSAEQARGVRAHVRKKLVKVTMHYASPPQASG